MAVSDVHASLLVGLEQVWPVRVTSHAEEPCSAVTMVPGASDTSPAMLVCQVPLCCAFTVGVPLISTFHEPAWDALTAAVPVIAVGTGSRGVFVTFTGSVAATAC
jgi:hypothetical protein